MATPHSNIRNLYIIKISKWFMLFMPVIILFFKENGLNMQQVFTLLSIGSITTVILEIPSGYLADAWGRKNTILVGCIIDFFGFIAYSSSSGFWGFAAGELLLGIGQSLVSGADSAILYDTLAEKKKENQYLKFEGRMVSVGNFAEAGAGILGGLLATLSLRAPFIGQAAIALVAIPAAALLREPGIHGYSIQPGFRDLLQVVKNSLITDKKLQIVIFFSSLIGSATLTMAWFVQPYFNYVGLPLSLFGVMWALLNLSVGITAFSSHRIERKLGFRLSIILITILIPAGYLSLGLYQSLTAIGLIFIFYLLRGFATPLLKSQINQIAPSGTRATVLSVRNLVIRLLFGITGPFLGWYSDKYGLPSAFLVMGIFYFTVSFALMLVLFERMQKSEG